MAHFPDKRRGDMLSHQHVNSLNAVAREANRLKVGSGVRGWGHHVAMEPPWLQCVAIVVDPELESSSSGETDDIFSCEGMATIRFRWFDPEAETEEEGIYGAWTTDDTAGRYACLDYKAVGLDEIAIGSILTVWWDAQRGVWVPVVGSPSCIRVSWSGSWEYASNKTVSIFGTSDTVKARNMLIGVGAGEGWIVSAAEDEDDPDETPAKWFLISFDYTKLASYDENLVQFLGHTNTGIMQWYDETTCEPLE